MEPNLYIILRSTRVNGVLVEKDRFIKAVSKKLYAETEVARINNQIRNVETELDGIEVLYFVKPMERN